MLLRFLIGHVYVVDSTKLGFLTGGPEIALY